MIEMLVAAGKAICVLVSSLLINGVKLAIGLRFHIFFAVMLSAYIPSKWFWTSYVNYEKKNGESIENPWQFNTYGAIIAVTGAYSLRPGRVIFDDKLDYCSKGDIHLASASSSERVNDIANAVHEAFHSVYERKYPKFAKIITCGTWGTSAFFCGIVLTAICMFLKSQTFAVAALVAYTIAFSQSFLVFFRELFINNCEKKFLASAQIKYSPLSFDLNAPNAQKEIKKSKARDIAKSKKALKLVNFSATANSISYFPGFMISLSMLLWAYYVYAIFF